MDHLLGVNQRGGAALNVCKPEGKEDAGRKGEKTREEEGLGSGSWWRKDVVRALRIYLCLGQHVSNSFHVNISIYCFAKKAPALLCVIVWVAELMSTGGSRPWRQRKLRLQWNQATRSPNLTGAVDRIPRSEPILRELQGHAVCEPDYFMVTFLNICLFLWVFLNTNRCTKTQLFPSLDITPRKMDSPLVISIENILAASSA